MKEQCKTGLLKFRWLFNPVILRIILWANTLFFRRRAILTTKSKQQAKATEWKKKHPMNKEPFCVALFFPPFSPTFVFSPVFTPWKINMEPTNHPFRKEKWSEPNLREDMCKMWIFQGVSFGCFQRFVRFGLGLRAVRQHRPSSFRPACGCQHRTCRCWRSRTK